MPPLLIRNTLTKKLEEFQSHGDTVAMYTCGPTVYSNAHLGNLRSYWFGSLVRRALEWKSYTVDQVINITDVGHIVGDADVGEDKLAVAARAENRTAMDVAHFYTAAFLKDYRILGFEEPRKFTPATQYIPEMISFIQELERKGFTYELPSGVYFDTSRFPHYGDLATVDVDQLQEGARVEAVEGKRNLTDFAVWRKYASDDQRLMVFNSPWGPGTPGWHIECSVMAITELGDRIDVHTGGVDHINVHHSNEIAQSSAYLGNDPVEDPWVRYWLHHEFITQGKGKVSKSRGGGLLLSDLVEMGLEPEAYLAFLNNGHYSKQLTLTPEILEQWNSSVRATAMKWARLSPEMFGTDADQQTFDCLYRSAGGRATREIVAAIDEHISNNLNVNQVKTTLDLALTSIINGEIEISPRDISILYTVSSRILGIDFAELAVRFGQADELGLADLPSDIADLATRREAARDEKDYALADELRAELNARGYVATDTAEGTKWSINTRANDPGLHRD